MHLNDYNCHRLHGAPGRQDLKTNFQPVSQHPPHRDEQMAQRSELDLLCELAARRRDVRRFRTDRVAEDLLDEIFRLVELAPSVGNSQPWRWVRVDSEASRAQVQAHFEITNRRARDRLPDEKKALYDSLKLAGLKEAPIQFAVFCDPTTRQGSGLGRQTMPEALHYSVVCAIMSFWLGAKTKGLGVGWVSILEPGEISTLLDVPKEWDLIAYLCVGYPVEEHYDPELERAGWQKRNWGRNHIISR